MAARQVWLHGNVYTADVLMQQPVRWHMLVLAHMLGLAFTISSLLLVTDLHMQCNVRFFHTAGAIRHYDVIAERAVYVL